MSDLHHLNAFRSHQLHRIRTVLLVCLAATAGCGYLGVETLDRSPDAGSGTGAADTETGTSNSDTATTSDTEEDGGPGADTESDTVDTPSDSTTDEGTDTDTPTSPEDTHSETGTATETDPEKDTSPDTGSETDTTADTDTATEPPEDTGPATDRDTDTTTVPVQDTTADTGTGTNLDTETATVPDTATDTETETGSATETEGDTCPPPPEGTPVVGPVPDWGSFGYANVTLETVDGGVPDVYWRCDRQGEAVDPTASQLLTGTTEDIAAGDTLLATFWVRCAGSAAGTCRTGFIFEENADPWTNGAEYYVVADSEWSVHQVPFTSPADFAAGGAQGTFRLGYDDQTIEIYPESIINYGDTTGVACLPASPGIWDSVSWVSTPETTAIADFEYRYRLEFNGKPTPEVTITGLPAWLEFNGTRLLSGIPPYTALGLTDTISITITNAVGSATQEFQIEVAVDPDLVAHWPLDETSGTVAYDASGQGNHGNLNGDPVWIPDDGQVGGALRFNGYDGAEDYLEIPSSPVLDDVQEGDYTVTAWVRPNSTPPSAVLTDNDAAYAILIKNGQHLGLWYGNDDQFYGTHYFDTGPSQVTSAVNPPGAYHHVAMRVNTTLGYMHLYVDGNYQGAQNFTPGEPPHEYGTSLWRIGIAYPDATEYGMISDADIDDVRIYSRSLAQAEIRSLAGW